MPTFIKTGFWDKLYKAPKGYLDLDLLISQHAGGGGVTSVTKAQIDTLISVNGLTPGAYYLISGVDVSLYGGTTILIQAATTNKLALAGHGIFYNPKYLNSQATPNNGYGIWQSTNIYSIGDDAIWGGKHWTNTSGSVGTSVDKYTLSGADWTVVPFDSVAYNVDVDIIHYDQSHDMIIRRKDKWNNDVDGNFEVFTEFASPDGYDYGNPIKDFQWGNGPEDFNTNDYWYLGVQSNYVKNSYLECINFIGEYLWSNTLTQMSYIHNNTTDKTSAISSNMLNLDSGITNNTLIGSFITDNAITRSSVYSNQLSDGSNINSNNLQNSNMGGNILVTGCYILGNNLSQGSVIGNNNLNSYCYIVNNTLSAQSDIANLTQIVSAITGCKLNKSNFRFAGTVSGLEVRKVSAEYSYVGENISTATIIYGDYAKQIFSNSAGVIRLGYYNASDVFTVVNVNA